MNQAGLGLRVKRGIDVLAASALLLLLAPLMGGIALLVRLFLGSPVIFAQPRAGQHGRPFTVFKFRTMQTRHDAQGQLLPDADRLPPLGRWLRALSLDELPQLWNVLRGDMSLVGPRPLLLAYLPRYSPAQARRHQVLPGITGWSQVQGRNALSWPRKLAHDIWYVDHWSLGLDARILWLTAWRVLQRQGVDHGPSVTMPEFRGGTEDAL